MATERPNMPEADIDVFDPSLNPPDTSDGAGADETISGGDGGGDRPRDEQGRFASQERTDGDGEPSPGQQQRQEPDHRIPLRELLDERERRQNAEREARELRAWREEQERQRQAPQRPDPITQPDEYDAWVQERSRQPVQTLEQQMQARWIDMTFADAHDANPEAFPAAFQALQSLGQRNPEFQRIVNAPNPGRALMRWHTDQAALREIGGDLTGYHTKLQDQWLKDPEFRKKALAAWRDEANGAGDRSNITELPSINRATGGAGNRSTVARNDEELFEASFGARRRT